MNKVRLSYNPSHPSLHLIGNRKLFSSDIDSATDEQLNLDAKAWQEMTELFDVRRKSNHDD